MALERVKRGDPITHEWANALVDAINALQITVSPPLQITKSARGGLVLSIGYGYDLTCVCELTEDLAAGGSASAKVLWDKDQDGEWVIDADTEEIEVYGPTDVAAIEGARLLVKFDRQAGLWVVWQFDRELFGTLDGSLSQGGSATMSVFIHDGSAWDDTGTNITVYDRLLKSGAAAISSGKWVVARFYSGRWWVTSAECN